MTQGFIEGFIQVIQGQPVQRFFGQLADGAHRRNHLVPTRFGQQRAVVAVPKVLVAATQVDHLHTLATLAFPGLFQVFLGSDDVFAGEVGSPIFLALDNDHHLT